MTILGHIQRGGSPTANDRILASRMGYAAVHALLKGNSGNMIGIQGDQMVSFPFAEMQNYEHKVNKELTEIARVLSK